MRRSVRLLTTAALAVIATLVPTLPAQSADASQSPTVLTGRTERAPVQDFLADELTTLSAGERATVLVHGIRSTAHKYSFGAPYVAGPGGVTTSYDKGAGLVDVVAAADALP